MTMPFHLRVSRPTVGLSQGLASGLKAEKLRDRVHMQAMLTQDALDLDAVQKLQADPHSERTWASGGLCSRHSWLI